MSITYNRTAPLFIQIADTIRRDILNGTYSPNEQIPTVRGLAFNVSANPNTVQKALSLLEDEGLLYTKGTAGRFVTSDPTLLEATRKRVKSEAMAALMQEAESLGITRADIMSYINEKEDNTK